MINHAPLIVCLMLVAAPSPAQTQKLDLMQFLAESINSESRIPQGQRADILKAVQARFANRAHDVVDGPQLRAAQTAVDILAAGAQRELPAERIAEVSLSAYTAVVRGSPAGIARGIALYGSAKDLSAERILSWANGHEQMTGNKVPPEVCAEAIRNAIDNDWDGKTFNDIKWGLVHAAKSGFDLRAYSSFVFARLLEDKSRPGAVLSEARKVFEKARAAGKPPELPPYQGLFTAFLKPVQPAAAKTEEKPKAAEAAPAPKPEEKPKAVEPAPAPKPEEKPQIAETAPAPKVEEQNKAAEAAPAPKPEEKTKAVVPAPAAKEPPSLEGSSSPLPEGAAPKTEEKPKAAEAAPAPKPEEKPKAVEPAPAPQPASN